MKRTLSYTGFLAALIGVAALPSSQSFAQAKAPEVYFYPSQTWAVGQADNTCSIRSQFNNGFILNFTGGGQWVKDLHVNFRQNVFKQGAGYDVRVSVPGIADKTLKAQALNGEELVLDLKGQKDLYQEIRKSAVLDLFIEQNNFRFYLTGFTNSAGEFERCMSGAKDMGVTVASIPEFDAPAQTAPEPVEAEQLVAKLSPEQKASASIDNELIASKPVTGTNTDRFVTNEALALEAEIKEQETASPEKPYKRLSEQLSEEILNNPEMIAMDKGAAPEKPAIEKPITAVNEDRQPLEMPPEMEKVLPFPEDAPEEAQPEIASEEPVVFEISEKVVSKSGGPEEEITQEPVEMEAKQEPIAIAEVEPSPEPPAEPEEVITWNENAQKTEELLRSPVTRKSQEPLTEKEETVQPMKENMVGMTEEDAKEAAATQLSEVAEQDVKTEPAPEELMAEPPLEVKEVEPLTIEKPKPVKIKKKTPEWKINKETITAEADFTHIEPAAAPVARNDSALKEEVAELRKTIEMLKSENMALNEDLKNTLKESEKERMTIASENWNLESATMKFNEAERQIKRLGQQLQKERAKHKAEKRDLETMLFDPQVTNEAQLARLAELEGQIEKLEVEMATQRARYEEQLRVLQSQQ